MTHSRHFALWLYSGLLRLYPPQFRAHYADEMEVAFALALQENENALSSLGLLLAEVRDLPVSVLREHWRERQQTRLVMFLEGFVFNRIYSPQRFRFCTMSLLGLTALFFFSAIAAYFVFNLHTNSIWEASEWWYAIGNQPDYIGNILPLGLAVVCFWLIAPVWIVVGGTLLALMLWRQRPQLTHRLRLWGITALIAAIAMFVSMGSPIGYMAALWFYD